MINEKVPQYDHNCAGCLFVGHYKGIGDIHLCVSPYGPHGGTLSIRGSSEEHDFETCSLVSIKAWERQRPRNTNQFTMALAKFRDEIRFAANYKGWKIALGWTPRGAAKISRDEALARWPRLVGHLICHSLGYATPKCAAAIIADAFNGDENWCEWIDAIYGRKPKPAVEHAFYNRRRHSGYMAEYKRAKQLVARELSEPGSMDDRFASWF